jgi:hypothetical protein
MAVLAWEVSVLGLNRQVSQVLYRKVPQLTQLAASKSKYEFSRLGRRSKKAFMQTGGRLDPTKLVKGYDNSETAWRWSGCGEKFGFANASSGYYCSTRSKNGLFSNVAAEFGHYENKGSQFTPEELNYWKPATLFPPETVLIDLSTPSPREQASPLMVFSPYEDDNLQQIETILGRDNLQDATEYLMCINMEAPGHIKSEFISLKMEHELTRIRQTKSGILSLEALLSSPSYAISSLVGNACLSSGIGLKVPSARSDAVPQQEFVEGGANIVVPVNVDGATNLALNGVWEWVPDAISGKGSFAFLSAEELASL